MKKTYAADSKLAGDKRAKHTPARHPHHYRHKIQFYILHFVSNISKKIRLWFRKQQKVSSDTITIFTRQIAVLFRAGLPVTRILRVLYEQADSRKLKTVIKEIYIDLCRKGVPLSTALKKHKDIFPDHYTAMVKAGETGAGLDKILELMAVNCEKETRMAKKIKSALVYPFILIILSACAVLFIIKFVLPVFAPMLLQSKKTLPLPTAFLMSLSKMMNNYVGLIIFAACAGIIFYLGLQYFKSKHGRMQLSLLMLNLPAFGKTVKMIALTKFCRAFAMLHASGVPLLENMHVSREVVNNAFIQSKIDGISRHIHGVDHFTEAFQYSGIFPPAITGMMNAGEESGRLPESLIKISDFYEDDIENNLSCLASMIEPILLAVLGCIVGFILLSVCLPLYDVISGMGGI